MVDLAKLKALVLKVESKAQGGGGSVFLENDWILTAFIVVQHDEAPPREVGHDIDIKLGHVFGGRVELEGFGPGSVVTLVDGEDRVGTVTDHAGDVVVVWTSVSRQDQRRDLLRRDVLTDYTQGENIKS